MRYVLHIGLPKCGSTSIQAFLSANVRALLEDGIIYPQDATYPTASQHSWLAKTINDPEGLMTDVLHACRRQPVAVLSGESFALLPEADVQRLRDRLQREGGLTEAKIILYVRNLADFFRSAMAEMAKLSGWSFERSLAHPMISLRRVVEVYETVFGAAAVDVRLLDDVKDLHRDFCEAAALPWRDDYVRPKPRNLSSDPIRTELLRSLRREYGTVPGDLGLLRHRANLPRIENSLLALIEKKVTGADLHHPKLAPFRDELTRIKWQDEKAGTEYGQYLDALITSLEQMRRQLP